MLTKLYVNTKLALENFKNDQRGVTAIEYAMIGVAMAVILGVAFAPSNGFGKAITDAFAKITSEITTVTGNAG